MLHIYTETMQPATGWTDMHSGEPMQMGFEPEKLLYTDCCGKQRPAKDCAVQCYYDGLSIWCAPEKGCKDHQVLAERKAREYANRSADQIAANERERLAHIFERQDVTFYGSAIAASLRHYNVEVTGFFGTSAGIMG